jgi:hypothetical protein
MGKNLLDNDARRLTIAGDNQIGDIPVKRVAQGKQRFKPASWISGLQQGTVSIMTSAAELFVHRGVQINHETPPSQTTAVIAIQHSAATGRQHDIRALGQFGHDRFLAQTKASLAFQFKNQGNAGAGPLLDFLVAVDKSPPERLRQPTANRGFASAHWAYQENGRSDFAHSIRKTGFESF